MGRFSIRPQSLAARGAVFAALICLALGVPLLIGAWRVIATSHACQGAAAAALLARAFRTTDPIDTQSVDTPDLAEALRHTELPLIWAGLIADGQVVQELRQRPSFDAESVVAQVRCQGHRTTHAALIVGGRPSARFELHTYATAADGPVLALVLDRGEGGTTALALQLLALGVLAAIGVGASLAWFRQAVARPLGTLHEQITRVHRGAKDLALADVPAELAGLVQEAAAMRAEVESWRGEVRHLRHAMDDAVQTRTRHAQRAQQQAQREAGSDALTGLANRRTFEQVLPPLFDRQRRAGEPLSLIVFDVDRFKPLNDTHGHPAGDRLLAEIGKLLRSCTRRGIDLAVRYGGDEFILVLPNTRAHQATALAERLKQLLAQQIRSWIKLNPPPGLSAGVAEWSEHGATTWEELLKRADQAMYRVKHRR